MDIRLGRNNIPTVIFQPKGKYISYTYGYKDSNGNLYALGSERDTNRDIASFTYILTKWNNDSNHQWTTDLQRDSKHLCLTTDNIGDIYLLSQQPNGSILLTVYRADGYIRNTHTLYQDIPHTPQDIKCDSVRNIYIAGYRERAYGENLGFVDKYDPNLKLIWSMFDDRKSDTYFSRLEMTNSHVVAYGKILGRSGVYSNYSTNINITSGRSF